MEKNKSNLIIFLLWVFFGIIMILGVFLFIYNNLYICNPNEDVFCNSNLNSINKFLMLLIPVFFGFVIVAFILNRYEAMKEVWRR